MIRMTDVRRCGDSADDCFLLYTTNNCHMPLAMFAAASQFFLEYFYGCHLVHDSIGLPVRLNGTVSHTHFSMDRAIKRARTTDPGVQISTRHVRARGRMLAVPVLIFLSTLPTGLSFTGRRQGRSFCNFARSWFHGEILGLEKRTPRG